MSFGRCTQTPLPSHCSLPKNLFFYITAQRDGHAELVSASHCEPYLVLLRGQILKFAVERVQSRACLNYAECEQIEQC